jgi:hypothetical protein
MTSVAFNPATQEVMQRWGHSGGAAYLVRTKRFTVHLEKKPEVFAEDAISTLSGKFVIQSKP